MQTTSVAFDNAIAAASRTWARPRFMVDWGSDGYGSPGDRLAPVRLADTFSRTETNGWGNCDTGQLWSISGTPGDYSVSGGQGKHSIGSVNAPRYTILSSGLLDVDATITFSVPVLATGSPLEAGIVLRYQDTSNMYWLACSFMTGAVVRASIYKVIAGTPTLITSGNLDRAHVAGRQYSLRAQASGTLLRMMLWETERLDPATWTLSTTDSSITAAGSVAFRSRAQTSNTNVLPVVVSVDNFTAINTGIIDDMSKISNNFSVSHVLDDGLPDPVSFVAGLGTGELECDLSGGHGGERVAKYFSKFNDFSAVSFYERDTAPIKLDVGIVTANGPEYVRVFTGQMANLPVQTRAATLEAMSATRLKMSKTVAFPPLIGINATWPISYALAQSGVYASPPPRAEARYWNPIHGAVHSFVPGGNYMTELGQMFETFPGDTEDEYAPSLPTFIDGPFVSATNSCMQPEVTRNHVSYGYDMADGPDLISQAANAGRFECWVRGDTAFPNNNPENNAIGFNSPYLVQFSHVVGIAGVYVGVDSSDRKVYITVGDEFNALTIKSPSALPTDGNWYFIGGCWDFTNNTYRVNYNGTVTSSAASPAIGTSNLPVEDGSILDHQRGITTYIPMAEVQISAGGLGSSASASDWVNQKPWTVGAVVRRSLLDLTILNEPSPMEAWEAIGKYAQAEIAMCRTDELDQFLYLPRSYWADTERQVVSSTLSTLTDVSELKVDYDPSKVRNSIVVNYDETSILNRFNQFTPCFQMFSPDETPIPPGISERTFNLDTPGFCNGTQDIDDNIDGSLFLSSVVVPATVGVDHITLNRKADGTGVYATGTQVDCRILTRRHTANSFTVRFTNRAGGKWYIANNSTSNSLPCLNLTGWPISIAKASSVKKITDSISRRSERTFTIDMPGIQLRNDAARLSRRLAWDLAHPVATLSGVKVLGDPRRQPGDLVMFDDSAETQADGLWRILGIEHEIEGARYIQTVRLQRNPPQLEVARYGISRYGKSIYGQG